MQIIVTKKGKEMYNAKTSDGKHNYLIKNNAKLFGHKYDIADSTNNVIGSIKKISSKKYILLDATHEIDQLIEIQKVPKMKYQLVNSHWTVAVDITFTEYIIYDEKNIQLAAINYNLPTESLKFNIDNDKDLNLLLLLLLTVISISKS